MNERDIIQEIMNDNKPTKGQKTKQGILISYRVLAMVALGYLSYLATDWNERGQIKEQKERLQNEQENKVRQDIISRLDLLTYLVKDHDVKDAEVNKKLDELQKIKADRSDLLRLEDRVDSRLLHSFRTFQRDTNLTYLSNLTLKQNSP